MGAGRSGPPRPIGAGSWPHNAFVLLGILRYGDAMEITAGRAILFIILMAYSAVLALLGSLFSRGHGLDLITLIDLSKHDRTGIAKVSSSMMFAMALGLSAAAALSWWVHLGMVILALLVITIVICSIGYICMARVPQAPA